MSRSGASGWHEALDALTGDGRRPPPVKSRSIKDGNSGTLGLPDFRLAVYKELSGGCRSPRMNSLIAELEARGWLTLSFSVVPGLRLIQQGDFRRRRRGWEERPVWPKTLLVVDNVPVNIGLGCLSAYRSPRARGGGPRPRTPVYALH
jgi:hypothetical protein